MQAAFIACAPRVTFSVTGASDPAQLVSASNDRFTGAVDFAAANLVSATDQCTKTNVLSFEHALTGVLTAAQTVLTSSVSESSARQFSSAFAGLSARAALQGCKALFDTFVTYSLQARSIPGQTTCMSQYGTADYLTNPCCNQNLNQARKQRTFKFFHNLNSSVVIRHLILILAPPLAVVCRRPTVLRGRNDQCHAARAERRADDGDRGQVQALGQRSDSVE